MSELIMSTTIIYGIILKDLKEMAIFLSLNLIRG